METYYQKHKLGTIILIWLWIIMLIATVVSSVTEFFLQDYYQKRQAFSVINHNLAESEKVIDVTGAFSSYFDSWMEEVIDPEDGSQKEYYSNDVKLEGLAEYNKSIFNEVSIVDDAGNITHSSDHKLIGTNIKDSEQLASFACLLEGETSYTDELSKDMFNDSFKEAHVGKAFRDQSGFVLFGLDKECLNFFYTSEIKTATVDSRIGLTGYIINCDPDRHITAATYNIEDKVGDTFTEEGILPENVGEIKESICRLYGEKCYVGARKAADYYIIGAYPMAEADQFKLQNNILFMVILVFVLGVFFIAFFRMLKKTVIKGVEKTHVSLHRITDGDLEEKVDVRGSLEFEELSAGINEMVDRLKELIRAEDERVKTELSNARYIQESAVPGKFPAFPDNEAFGLFASMNAAKDVGGDFFDYFMVNENTLAVVMADVSEKGLPAALYMMRAKTLIKSFAEAGLSVEDVAAEVNRKLCEDSSTDMFVTAWIGFLDISTGLLSYVHAGHTLPLLAGREVSFVKQKINAVLGGFKKAKYVRQELMLMPGDFIFLYTDGVTEAHASDGSMYGEERLKELIERERKGIDLEDRNDFCRAVCEKVLSEVNLFSEGAEQYDDITMMCLKYQQRS